MRFKVKRSPKSGDKRIRSAFLIFPRTINAEKRWLEYASWEEEYGYVYWHARKWL